LEQLAQYFETQVLMFSESKQKAPNYLMQIIRLSQEETNKRMFHSI